MIQSAGQDKLELLQGVGWLQGYLCSRNLSFRGRASYSAFVLTFLEHSGLLCSQLAGCGKLMHLVREGCATKSQKLEKTTY